MNGATQASHLTRDDAGRLLSELEGIRHQTRARLQSFWHPLLVFGVLTALSTPFFWVWDGAGVALYWALATPVGWVVVARHQRRRTQELGLSRSDLPYVVVGGALVAGCFATGAIGGATGIENLAAAGPPLSVASGYAGFAWLEHSRALAVLAFALASVTVGLVAAVGSEAAPILAVVVGTVLVGVGLAYRRRAVP